MLWSCILEDRVERHTDRDKVTAGLGRRRKYGLSLVAVLVTVSLAAGPMASAGAGHVALAQEGDDLEPMTVTGDIWDSVCAAAASHGNMMAKLHANSVTECTLDCVKNGAEFVLYIVDDKVTFRLDHQNTVRQYAGQKVTVVGAYDRASNILHVDTIHGYPG